MSKHRNMEYEMKYSTKITITGATGIVIKGLENI
jgi:hypothetical protein